MSTERIKGTVGVVTAIEEEQSFKCGCGGLVLCVHLSPDRFMYTCHNCQVATAWHYTKEEARNRFATATGKIHHLTGPRLLAGGH